jgi:hypothetical protein
MTAAPQPARRVVWWSRDRLGDWLLEQEPEVVKAGTRWSSRWSLAAVLVLSSSLWIGGWAFFGWILAALW